VTTTVVLNLLAAAIHLGIAILAILRGSRAPLGRPLGLLGVGFFAYHSLDTVDDLTDQPQPKWLAYAIAPLLCLPLVSLLLGFVGERRRYRREVLLVGVGAGALSLVSLGPFFMTQPWLEAGDETWALCLLAVVVPAFGLSSARLSVYVRRSSGAERAKARLLVAALVLGVGSVVFDLAAILGADLPRLSHFGLLAAASLIAAVALDARVLRVGAAASSVAAAAIAATAVMIEVALVQLVDPASALLWLGTVAVFGAAMAGLRPVIQDVGRERARQVELSTLGRFTEQMAHDLKNPLAAIRGAAELLVAEREAAAEPPEDLAMLRLIVERTHRIARVLDTYQRLGRVDPEREELDVRALFDSIVAGEQASASGETRVLVQVAPEVGRFALDPDLVTHAVENLVRNAKQALAEVGRPGKIVVRVTALESGQLSVEVEDDGPGMDPRLRELATDPFFTTRADGSGLGLPYAVRVARAHGGDAEVDSTPGRGTRILLRFAPEVPSSQPSALASARAKTA
jgi:signal transduction histidine kinase